MPMVKFNKSAMITTLKICNANQFVMRTVFQFQIRQEHRNIQIAKTYEKKLSNLTHNKVLPFTPNDVITNLYSYKFSHEKANILKYGFGNLIPPESLSRTDVFVNFDLIHCYLTEELKSRDDENSLRSNLSYFANSYYSNYKPTRAVLKKQRHCHPKSR